MVGFNLLIVGTLVPILGVFCVIYEAPYIFAALVVVQAFCMGYGTYRFYTDIAKWGEDNKISERTMDKLKEFFGGKSENHVHHHYHSDLEPNSKVVQYTEGEEKTVQLSDGTVQTIRNIKRWN